MSRLLMPMGFCAILGGTMTMVGSSPLILLNDLILGTNQTLPAEHRMETFDLFDVTPIGAALVATHIPLGLDAPTLDLTPYATLRDSTDQSFAGDWL